MARQHALITRRQAIGAGLTAKQVDGRVYAGAWVIVTRGVYRSAASPSTWRQLALAACLGRTETFASSLTGVALLGLWRPPRKPYVIVPPRASTRLTIAYAYRGVVPAVDRTRVGVIPCTGAARSIVESAAVLEVAQLEELVDTALCSERTTKAAIEAAAVRAGQRRRGSSVLRDVLRVWSPGIVPGSPAESRLLRRLDEWGFVPPVRQHVVVGAFGRELARLDAAWPATQVGLEYDGVRFHSPRRWVHDEARHAELQRLGWCIRHVDKTDLMPGDDRLRRDLEGRLPARLLRAV